MSSALASFYRKRFSEYNFDGAEHWCKEGYSRGWLDQKEKTDKNITAPWECPKMYREDYGTGYEQGFRESKDDDEMGF